MGFVTFYLDDHVRSDTVWYTINDTQEIHQAYRMVLSNIMLTWDEAQIFSQELNNLGRVLRKLDGRLR